MAIASKQLLAFVFATAFFLVLVPNNVHSQPDHIDFEFDEFPPEPKDLTYERDAFVPPDSTYVRLTKTDESGYPQQNSVGRVLYSHPVKFSDPGRQATFETTIKFAIMNVSNDPADGITFFIVPFNSTCPQGGEGRYLGIYNALKKGSHFFAVEFDTYVNTDEPRFRHVGVNIYSDQSENVTHFDDAALGREVTARINYEPNTRKTIVTVYGFNNSTLTYHFNLKTHLPQLVQVGISASTGSQVQVNELQSWYFSSTLVRDSANGEENYIKQYVM